MKKTVMLALTAMMAVTAMAQPQVQNAFETLKRSGFVSARRTNHNWGDNGERTGLLEVYEFTTSTSADRRVVRELINAFATDSEDAYSYVSHQAGEERQRYAIYYDRENSETIGRNKDDNYVLLNVMDPDDATNTYRYCYALEWRETDGGQLKGRALKTYAPKPAKSSKSFAWRHGDRKLGSINIPQGDGTSYTLELDSLVGGVLDKTFEGLGKLERIEDLGDLADNLGDLQGLQDLKDRIVVLSNDDPGELANDVEWLTSFNHYRNAFKRAAAKESSTMASYATSILKLCKNAKKAHLTEGELNLCRKSIKEMQKMTKDSFVKGLLDEAIANLRE